MDVLINVVGQQLKTVTNMKSVVSGTQNFIRFKFDLNEDWDGLTVNAQFIQNGEAVQVALDANNAVYLPSSIVPGQCILVIYGTDGNGIRATTNYLSFNITKDMIVDDPSSIEMTESVYDMIVRAVTGMQISQSDFEAIVLADVSNVIDQMRQEGVIADLTIEDGTIGREKVNAEFEETLKKADTAIQRNDPNSVDYGMLSSDLQTAIDTIEHLDMTIPDGSISRTKVDADFEATLAKADDAILYSDTGSITEDLLSQKLQEKIDGAMQQIDDESITLSMLNTDLKNAVSKANTAMQSIDDRSISRSKVDAAFEATLAKADSAMQEIEDRSIARSKVDAGFEATLAKADNAVSASIVNELPQEGVANVDYYVKNAQNIYEHYRWVNGVFEEIGSSSSTTIVDELPETGYEDIDYIWNNNGEYQYYKYINGEWIRISGGSSEVFKYPIRQFLHGSPEDNDMVADASTVAYFYLDMDTLTVYSTEIVMDEHDNTSYEWTITQRLVETPSETKDYYLEEVTSGNVLHFRYIENKFMLVGSNSYSKDEVDTMINNINTNLSNINSDVSRVVSQMENISNMVKDVTINQTKDTLTVTYMNDATSTIELDKGIDIDSTRYNVDDDHKLHFYDASGNELENLAVEITGAGGGGGGTTSGSVIIGRITSATTQAIFGDDCTIEYNVTATDASGEQVGDGTGVLYVNNVAVLTGFTVSTSITGAYNSIDIGEYLSVGTNTIKINVSVDTGGETNSVATKTWSVNAVNMYLSWDYTDSQINSSAVTDYYTPYGALNKTIYTFIDVEPVGFNPKIVSELPDTSASDFNPDDVIGVNYFVGSSYTHYVYDQDSGSFVAGVGSVLNVNSTTRSGVVQTLSIPMQSHGSHAIVRFMSGDMNGESISTAAQVHDMIFVQSGQTTPIIATSFNTSSMVQYNTVQIPIVAYDPSGITTTVVLAENGQELSTWTGVDRSVHYWNYSPTTAGTKTLTIRCGSVTKTIKINVTPLDISEEEIAGYDFRFKASEMATNAAVKEWSNTYRPTGSDIQKTVNMTFSENFDWINGGLHTEYDEDNHIRQYFCVRAGTSVTINYNLFGKEYDPKQYGKNFKFIFKAVNCRTYDAQVLKCMDESSGNNGVGLIMTANEATFNTANNNIKTYYYKDSYIEFETNIHPNTEYPYLQFWMDGSHDVTKLYDSSDDIQQVNPVGITIGSPNCDVYIYMIKAYPIYLTNDNELSNFIMDAPNAYAMVDRYNRNDILNANGDIDYQKLAVENPDLHVLCLDLNRMSTGKKDNVVAYSVRHIYNRGGASHCYTVNNACVTIQGTSSVGYLESAGNVDINFKNGRTFTSDNVSYTTGSVEFDDGTSSTSGYAMSENSMPVDYMNVKVNVASSENANNACIADWYNTYQPWTSPARAKNPKARDTMEFVPGAIFIRDRSGNLFYTEQQDAQTGQVTRIPDTQNYHLYGICDIGNSKKNTKVFHDTSNPIACCVEVANNTSLPCLMSSKDYTWNADDEATIMELDPETGELKEQKVFEFRYSNDDTVDLAKAAWDRFVSFMYDYNPNLATNEPLDEPVTFGNYTFKGSGKYDTSNYDSETYNVIYLYGYGDPATFGYAASEYVTNTSEDADCYYYINYSNNQIYSSDGSTWTSAGTLTWTRDQNNVLGGTSIGTYAKTYTTDSSEYRIAYMLNHCEEYMVMDPVIYHFVFIESYLMTDNVAKNTFWSSDDLVHWELSKNYDDDTSLGNDE